MKKVDRSSRPETSEGFLLDRLWRTYPKQNGRLSFEPSRYTPPRLTLNIFQNLSYY